MRATLARDITAADLAMDSPDPNEGYRPEHVIGPKGTTVTVTIDDEGDPWVEVEDFENDPFANGWVGRADLIMKDGD